MSPSSSPTAVLREAIPKPFRRAQPQHGLAEPAQRWWQRQREPAFEQSELAVMLELDLPAVPASAATARHALSRVGGVGPPSKWDLRLVVSELVSNAIARAQVTGDEQLRLRLLRVARGIRIEVWDEQLPDDAVDLDGEPPLQARSRAWSQSAGQAMTLVARIARRWGVDRAAGCVWAELAL